MATQERLPTSDGAINNWTALSGGSKFSEVDDPVGTPDDATSYVYKSGSNGAQQFGFTAFSISSSAISLLKQFVRIRHGAGTTGGRWVPRIGVNGVDYSGTTVLGGAIGTSFGDHSNDWLTNPATGAAWTEADIEGTGAAPLQTFYLVASNISGTNEIRCTQTYLQVDYTASGGGLTSTKALISKAEFETPLVSTRGRISFSEFESPLVSTRGRVSYAVTETPGVATRALVSFGEFEAPLIATRGKISHVEAETPLIITRGRVSYTVFESPATASKALISRVEFETPLIGTHGRISFVEGELPNVITKGRISHLVLDAPNLLTKGRISFLDVEVPEFVPILLQGRIAFIAFEIPNLEICVIPANDPSFNSLQYAGLDKVICGINYAGADPGICVLDPDVVGITTGILTVDGQPILTADGQPIIHS